MKHTDPAASTLGFYIHALVFAIAMVIQIAINVWTGPPYWVQWVLPGWGLGVLIHWWCVLGPGQRARRLD
jgi:hypothetical protein